MHNELCEILIILFIALTERGEEQSKHTIAKIQILYYKFVRKSHENSVATYKNDEIKDRVSTIEIQ